MASKDVIDTLIAEAGGEGEAGLIAAAWAIQQRAAARGQTVDQVIKSGFDGYSNPGSGAIRAQQDPRLRAKVEQIMTGVENGSIPNPVPGADHFLSGTVSPGWSKNMKHVATIGGHRFYASGNVPQTAYGTPLPPGELPQVATALSTAPMPRISPTPATPSIDMAQMRRISAPSQLVADSMARVKRPARNLGDDIGMSPILGGKQNAPLFDAGYDTRTGSMRLFSNGPADTQGVYTAASRPPAPIPAMPSPQLAARRANDPTLQAALNARYPAQLPPLPPPIGQGPTTRMVQSVPVRPTPGNLSVARNEQSIQRSVAPSVSRPYIPATMTVEQMYAGIYPSVPGQFRVGSTDGLGAGNPNGAVSTAALTGSVNAQGLPVTAPFQVASVPAVQPTAVGGRPVAPVPFMRPPGLGGAPRIAPVPFPRPTSRPIVPMPPMPIARPGTGGPFRIAQTPMPLSMRPASRPTASRPPLRITVNGGSGSGSGSGSRPTPQGYTDTGNGRLVSDETGGVYFTRHL